MIDASLALLELRMEVQRAEAAAKRLPFPAKHDQYEDHRTDIIGELLGALDRIDPGLGTRLQQALYPRSAAHLSSQAASRRVPK